MTASTMQGNDKNSSAKEERKLRKPLIEKKRRERINCSLEQLKGIMVDAYNLDQSKLEKADVLEITVQHMEGLQKGNRTGSPAGPGEGSGFEARQRYSTGYIQCMHEVHNLLLSYPGLDKSQGARLLNHLLGSLPHVDAGGAGRTGSLGSVAVSDGGAVSSGSPLSGSGSGPGTPPCSPLSLPAGAPFRPRRRLLLLPPPSSPSPPRPPPHAPQESVMEEEPGVVREMPPASLPGSPPPVSPALPQPLAPGAHSGLPQFLRGGDPSMWRPW
ncbi:hairy-related 8a [Osmerus eperlanus]|uniref:hairy-related 8a n=1 Tax=Osmerus eperlanus TaxID=29151 RepID=UPI002E1544B8